MAFAEALNAQAAFRSNLIISGPKGSDFTAIVRDLSKQNTGEREYFHELDVGDVSIEVIEAALTQANHNRATRLTLVLAYPEMLTPEQQQWVFAVARRREPFEDMELSVRYVFLLNEDIDHLYDNGRLPDDMYMFMGTNEIKVPALKAISEDIPVMALRIMRGFSQKAEGQQPRLPCFDARARIFLREREWSGNTAELKAFCRAFVALGKSDLSREDIEAVEREVATSYSAFNKSSLYPLLAELRDDLCLSALALFDGDCERSSAYLGCTPQLIQSVSERHS